MHKIWVADDDAAIRTILEESLNTAGFETTIFPDADSLIDNLNTSQPDLVITDIKMPGTHGYDLLKHFNDNQLTMDKIAIACALDYTMFRYCAPYKYKLLLLLLL